MGFNMGGASSLGGALQGMAQSALGAISGSLQGALANAFGGGGKKGKTFSVGSDLPPDPVEDMSNSNFKYRYRVEVFNLILPSEPDPLTLIHEAITRMSISRLYDEALQPIFQLHVNLPPKIYKKFLEEKEDARFHIRIGKVQIDPSEEEVFVDEYINGIFLATTDDEPDFKDEEEYDAVNEAEGGEGDDDDWKRGIYNISNYTVEYIIPLWRENDLKGLRSVVNESLSGATISTVMTKVYTDAGIEKVLMAPIDNDGSYGQLMIPPMNLLNVHEYLQKVYGTYYTGTVLFADFRCLYVLDRSGLCTAYEDEEFKRTIILVMRPKDDRNYRVGTEPYEKGKLYFQFVNQEAIEFSSPSASADLIGGNNVTLIDSNTNETTEVNGAGTQSGDGNSRVVAENYSNDFSKTTLLADIVEANLTLTVTITDYDEFAFTPNKEYLLVYEEKEKQAVNGYYRLTSSNAVFVKRGDDYDITGTHTFAYKAPLSEDDTNKILAMVKPQFEQSQNSESANTDNAKEQSDKQNPASGGGTVTGDSTASGEKVEAPQPRNVDTTHTVNNVPTDDRPPTNSMKSPNQEYDEYGNVKGYNIPEYNRITQDDSKSVVKSKMEAQKQYLPCEGPKPRQL